MNNCAIIISDRLDKTGNTVYLRDESWISTPFKACIFRLWNRQRSAFEHDFTEIGQVTDDYYLYLGPAEHNITALSENAVVLADDGKYEFKRRNEFKSGDDVLYYTGILKKIQGEYDYDDE